MPESVNYGRRSQAQPVNYSTPIHKVELRKSMHDPIAKTGP
jgi:hypothetical protein